MCARAARQAHCKSRAFARLARHCHVAAHHAGQLAREREDRSPAWGTRAEPTMQPAPLSAGDRRALTGTAPPAAEIGIGELGTRDERPTATGRHRT